MVQLFPSAFVRTNAVAVSLTLAMLPGDAETLTLSNNNDAADACMNLRRLSLIIANASCLWTGSQLETPLAKRMA
jgi:hypothetical protein